MEIAAEESGDPRGAPVFFFHGWPASRLQGAGFGPAASALGLRIIALDRPGIGCSPYREGRRLTDWPPIVAEIARQLGLETFRVLGVSGGGPYALATAWALPERVQAVAFVCGAPPLDTDAELGQLLFVYRWMLRLYRKRPELLRIFFRVGRPFATIRPPHWLVQLALRIKAKADAAAIRDRAAYEGTFECYREAWRGSALGVATDGELYANPWGFPPEEIRVPVQVWHGTEDRNFNVALAEQLARRIPGAELHIKPGEGHYSLPYSHASEILRRLIGAAPAQRITHAPASL